MSKHYWDEYLEFSLDKTLVNKILKFNQSTVSLNSLNDILERDENKRLWIDVKGKEIASSDTIINRYAISDIEGIYKQIFKTLSNIFAKKSINIIVPILCIYEDNACLKKGVYSFDFKGEYLVLYKEIEKNSYINNHIKFSISWFIDIEKSTYIYNFHGYKLGIFEAGSLNQIIEQLMYDNKLSSYDLFIKEQKLTHDLGLNIRKLIHVYSLFIGD